MSAARQLARGGLAAVVLLLGVGVFAVLLKTRPKPEKQDRPDLGVLVEVASVRAVKEKLTVQAQGTVIPAREIVVQPEVAARVLWQHKELVPGGRFKKGEVVVKLDPRDYALGARREEANVNRAELELKLEQSRKQIAKREWEIIGEGDVGSKEGKSLALREPQLDNAKVNLEAAKSARAQARLAVSKTAIRAPFNAVVRDETVDVGQLVSPQTPLATLVGTDAFWVQVSIPVDKLAWLDVPYLNAKAGEGATCRVWQEVGGQRIVKQGRVVRLLGDVDPVGRMARLLVEIDDPLGLKQDAPEGSEKSKPPLPVLLGSYVHIEIDAREVEQVVELPRLALRSGNQVFLYSKDGRLEVRGVEIIWRREQSVLVNKGLSGGETVVVSKLPNAVPGLRLRKAQESKAKTVLGQR